MFGRKKSPSPQNVERELLTPELKQLIVTASVELTAKNEAALEAWNIGSADSWSADLAAGTISFAFPDHSITGPVQFLGSYSAATGAFQPGWRNAAVPDAVKAASVLVCEYGEKHGIEALTLDSIPVPDWMADDFAAIAVELAGLGGMYRGPGAVTSFLGFTTFTRSATPID